MLILKASLASAEVSAGAVAKADQYFQFTPLIYYDQKEPLADTDL